MYTKQYLTVGDRCADKIAKFGGTWKFVIMFSVFCALWIVFNHHIFKFDPYPYILLNLFLSCLAAIQAPIILMSQNRATEIDNIKTKADIQNITDKLNRIIINQESKRK